MTQFTIGYGLALITALFVIFGDFAIKLAADAGHSAISHYVLFGVAIYGASAILWFFAMHHVSLAQAGVAYSMLTLISLAIIGAVWFGETLQTREYLGLGCAVLSMLLMSRIT